LRVIKKKKTPGPNRDFPKVNSAWILSPFDRFRRAVKVFENMKSAIPGTHDLFKTISKCLAQAPGKYDMVALWGLVIFLG